MYWAEEDVQEKAKKNSESRRSYTDTHTAGPKSFAQIQTKLPEPSDAAIFVRTCKRKPGREYKSNTDGINYRHDKIGKALAGQESGINVHELVTDCKSRAPTWLIGRHVKFVNESTSVATTNTYIQDLTTHLVDEMEAKVYKKVQEEVDSKVNRKI
ncbi:uncharacterized protein LOC141678079 [Apium graveolens]|uniref:uncharacterized protein LOC141678079 n=1 Tax=Apium graveolens TaxID=4045 RepID=UPI003D7BB38C